MKKVLILAYDFPPYVSVGGFGPNYWLKIKEMDSSYCNYSQLESYSWHCLIIYSQVKPKKLKLKKQKRLFKNPYSNSFKSFNPKR